MKPKLIITGASGLLGQYLCPFFSDRYQVVGLQSGPISPENNPYSLVQLNLTEENNVKRFLSDFEADFVIHTAGLTSVDECQKYPQMAQMLNVEMTRLITHYLNPAQTRLIYISTDHLFSGTRSLYSEEDPVEPLNVYAETKWKAEKIVNTTENFIIVRTNFYGGKTQKKKSFSQWIFDELKSGKTIQMFSDVFFTPLSIHSLAESIEKLLLSKLQGTYNVVGRERISKLEFAKKLSYAFDLNPELIIPTYVDHASLKARRPHDMSLSIKKIKNDLPDFIEEDVVSGLLRIKNFNLI